MYNPILANDGLGDELPPALEKIRAQLREAGPLDEDDPIHALTERAMLGKVFAPGNEVAEGVQRRIVLEKLCGDGRELVDSDLADPIGEVLARASRPPALAKFMTPALRKEGVDPTWSELLNPAGTSSNLAKGAGDWTLNASIGSTPAAHEDGTVTRSWNGGSTSVFWKNGQIVASRLEYEGPEGTTEIEVFDGSGDPISQGEFAALTRV